MYLLSFLSVSLILTIIICISIVFRTIIQYFYSFTKLIIIWILLFILLLVFCIILINCLCLDILITLIKTNE